MNRNSSKTGVFLLIFASLTMLLAACGSSTPAPVVSEPTSEPVSEPTSNPPTAAPTEIPPATEAPAESQGMSPENPLPLTGKVVTPEWEIEVLEVIRGEEAMSMLKQVSGSNKAHEEAGMEYALVRLRVKYVGTQDTGHVYGPIFRSLDSANEIYRSVSFIDVKVPEPELEADLAFGEETEGWVAIQAGKEATGLMLVVWPYISYENYTAVFSDATDKWYISLE
ncbi:MAG: hypothetical protein JW730_01910 [Anaerolineales bacterium]|nr:hypothetical protein [Anaerolineales bacterium]